MLKGNENCALDPEQRHVYVIYIYHIILLTRKYKKRMKKIDNVYTLLSSTRLKTVQLENIPSISLLLAIHNIQYAQYTYTMYGAGLFYVSTYLEFILRLNFDNMLFLG